ncbi:DUF2293 domain-containing protein [Arthrobacter sp. NPDC093128]|uniref:DUF2293 domain-containing protein n=1 Tax=Arthrobacter sp. NPDC093128 TaxID=3154979 RepID=UPI00341C21F9
MTTKTLTSGAGVRCRGLHSTQDTDYDALLMAGVPRDKAREQVRENVGEVLDLWRRG